MHICVDRYKLDDIPRGREEAEKVCLLPEPDPHAFPCRVLIPPMPGAQWLNASFARKEIRFREFYSSSLYHSGGRGRGRGRECAGSGADETVTKASEGEEGSGSAVSGVPLSRNDPLPSGKAKRRRSTTVSNRLLSWPALLVSEYRPSLQPVLIVCAWIACVCLLTVYSLWFRWWLAFVIVVMMSLRVGGGLDKIELALHGYTVSRSE